MAQEVILYEGEGRYNVTLYEFLCGVSERTDKVFLQDIRDQYWGVWELLYLMTRASRIKGFTWGSDLMNTPIFVTEKKICRQEDGSIMYRITQI